MGPRQPPYDDAEEREFFQRARELMDADDYEEAMRVLEEGWSREYEEGNNG